MDRQERTATEMTAQPEAYRRILVGTDGSTWSERAARHAVYLARELGARLYAVNSVNVERAFSAGIHFAEAVTELRRTGKEATAAVKVTADAAGVECEEILASGRPHRAIVEVSDEVDADLIVVGSLHRDDLPGACPDRERIREPDAPLQTPRPSRPRGLTKACGRRTAEEGPVTAIPSRGLYAAPRK